MNEWELHQQQQQQHQAQQQHQQQRQHSYRSQSVSIPSAQFPGPSQSSTHYGTPVEYGQQQQAYDRRQQPQYTIPPLQVNPSSFRQSDVPMNLPSSSLSGAHPSMQRSDRHRTQSVALTSIGQREGSYGPSPGYPHSQSRMSHSHRSGPPLPYTPEASVPISRHSSSSRSYTMPYPGESAEGQPVPYISSVMSPYAQPAMGAGGMHPSRVMPPLSELDRRTLPTVEEAQPKAKPHVCDQCGAAFSRAHDLKRHVDTHKGDRPHKCPTCTKAFSRKDALQRHQSMAQCGIDGQDSSY
ncbi:hypothetical protein BDV93DRAFT_602992 [Ceratobasidium sp. AG-I]|nr:hypothetical protein BDV93DRAFT_602992 [Ceratobasidium sp. AG-I]